MPRQFINNLPQDSRLGDSLYTAINKINSMTLELYDADSSFQSEIEQINALINDGLNTLDHKHTINQITGLQTALNNKVSTNTFNTNILAINAAIQVINDTLSQIIDILNTKVEEAPFSGITYGRKDGTWVEISGGTSNLNLQQVTDNGNTTSNQLNLIFNETNGIVLSPQDGSSVIQIANDAGIGFWYPNELFLSYNTAQATYNTEFISLLNPSLQPYISLAGPNGGVNIKTDLLNNPSSGYDIQFPDKTGSTYTFATTEDIIGAQDLQSVLTQGAYANLGFQIYSGFETLSVGYNQIQFNNNNGLGTYTSNNISLYAVEPTISLANGNNGIVTFRIDNVVNDYVLQAPNKVDGTYTIATTEDLINLPLTQKGDLLTRTSTTNERLPVGLDTQVLIADSSTSTGLRWGSNTTPPANGYYGSFYDLTNQTATTINTPYAIKLSNTSLSNGISIVNNSRITISNTGIYNIQFSAQFYRTNTGTDVIDIWLRKNGVDVPDTNTQVVMTGGIIASQIVPAWNFVVNAIGGDYFELMWATPDTHVELLYSPSQSTPFIRPAIPSVILTVTQQSGIMSGTGITAINSLTNSVQTIVTGNTGSDFNIISSGSTHTFNLPTASATNRGALSQTDWSRFNDETSFTVISDGYPSSGFTGGTSSTRTLVKSYKIPANTFSSGDTGKITAYYGKTGTSTIFNLQVDINTANTLTGAVSIGRSSNGGATTTHSVYDRVINFSSSTSMRIFNATNFAPSDIGGQVGTPFSTITFNTAVDNWIFFSIIPNTGGTSDLMWVEKVLITRNKNKIT